ARGHELHAARLEQRQEVRTRRVLGGAQLRDERTFLLEKGSTETRHQGGQDGSLVRDAGCRAEPWTAAELAARRGEAAVVRVRAELLVRNAGVVRPRKNLLVRTLHVVGLVERIDERLPIGRQYGAQARAEPHILQPVGREQRREWVEKVDQRLGI